MENDKKLNMFYLSQILWTFSKPEKNKSTYLTNGIKLWLFYLALVIHDACFYVLLFNTFYALTRTTETSLTATIILVGDAGD